MKKLFCFIIVLCMFLTVSVNAGAEAIGGSTNNPLKRDEILKGTITAFDEEDGDFGTTVYYVKVQDEYGEEYMYELDDKVYFKNGLSRAKNVIEKLKAGEKVITYALREEKIKYINPYMIIYNGDKEIELKKGKDAEITVEISGADEKTLVKWTSDSKIIFEFLEFGGEWNETVKIKGRIVGKATLTAKLYADNMETDSIDINVRVTGSAISAGTNKPVSPDEIQMGVMKGFDTKEGTFGTTENYVKIENDNGEEVMYSLSNVVEVDGETYTSDDALWVLQNSDVNITYVLRSGKIRYVNPYMPDGIFESAKIESCYEFDGKIITQIAFEYLVGDCVVVIAAYDENDIMCSVKSFTASYKDAYSYSEEMDANGGEYVKVFFLKSVQSLEAECSYITAVVE